MLAAGAGVELVLVAAGVFVVLGFVLLANRRTEKDAPPSPGAAARRPSRAPLPGAPWERQAKPRVEVAPGRAPRPQQAPDPQGLAPRPGGRTHDPDERRDMPRATLVRPVVLHRARGAERTAAQRTFALDLGTGGALVAGPADLTLGEELELVLDIGENGLGARATVVRETAEGLKGLRFEHMTPEDLDRLERYVAGD